MSRQPEQPGAGTGPLREWLVSATLPRRGFLKTGAALIVAIAAEGGAVSILFGQTGGALQLRDDLSPESLDSWIAIGEDGAVTAFFGKMDMGQGVGTAIAQMVADELDVAFERVRVVMGDTALTCDQGGASGSTAVQAAGRTLRNAAAEARRVLLEVAADQLGAAADQLTVTDGVVSVRGMPARSGSQVTYAELMGGREFGAPLAWNGVYGNGLLAEGRATPKGPDELTIVGQPIPDSAVPDKVFGRKKYITDVRVPGMLHARMIRPMVAGAVPVNAAASVAGLPGVRVVHKEDLLAVVGEDEWEVIRAAEELDVRWSEVEPPFPAMDELFKHIRDAPVAMEGFPVNVGDVDRALSADRVIEAEYLWPFQSHASMGPACAIAEVRGDEATIWTGSQKPYDVRYGVAKLLNLPVKNVRAIWVLGPGSYGRNDAGDAAMDAAVLAREMGRPVRVQYMRAEGTGWDPKGPASVIRMRAALGLTGEVTAYEFRAKGFSRVNMAPRESEPGDTLAGMLLGFPPGNGHGFLVPDESYVFPSKRMSWQTIAPLLERASPLRTAHFRDPNGPEVHFASESFIDELAAAAGSDPVEFRLRYITDPRHATAVRAAADHAGWDPRPSPKEDLGGDVLTGRGIAYAERNGAVVAVVAQIEVDRRSGRIWPRKLTVAHDCGLIVNPLGIRKTIEGNVMQATSRTLFEEVRFDHSGVNSLDWLTYPILETPDVPETIDTVLINRPELPPRGAGEPSTRVPAPAIANAFFDATGVRLRQVPFTRERVLAALG